MKEPAFEAKLRNINKVKMPLVKAAFQGKDGNVYIGQMLIDTGCVDCILNRSIVPLLHESAKLENSTHSIFSMESHETVCQGYNFAFRMGNLVFGDTFYVNPHFNFDSEIEGFIGIIGHSFLRKHKYVLDYETKTLRSSDGSLGELEDYEFFFPMEVGIENYNIPIVGLVSGEKEFVMIADSGADYTLLTRHTLDELGLSSKKRKLTGSVKGFSNKIMETSTQRVQLPLLSIGGTAESPKICICKDNANVTSEIKYIMEGLKDPKGQPNPPISGLLSSSFMLKHKWVLDFGLGVMYSKKSA